jgi:hypothetical protein
MKNEWYQSQISECSVRLFDQAYKCKLYTRHYACEKLNSHQRLVVT